MKTKLWLLVAVGATWLGGLTFESRVTPVFQLDAVVPAKMLASANTDERMRIQESLREISRPSYLSWFAAGAVLVLSGLALRSLSKPAPQKNATNA